MFRPIDIVYVLAAVVLVPVVAYERVFRGKRRSGWRQRFGHVPARNRPGKPCLWIHAVSVGEVNATRQLVEALRQERPDVDVVVSATTDTGFDRARQLYPDLQVVRYPLDLSCCVRRALDRIHPDVLVLMELEVWPNMVAEAHRRGIPLVVVNGRITERRSMRRFGLPLVRRLVRRMFARLSWVGAQDQTYADRFRQLGVLPDRVEVTGSMKWDTALIADRVDGDQPLAQAMGIRSDRPLWVCGSTGPGEEAIVLEAYEQLRAESPELQLAIVPRKPERFDEVAAMIEQAGYMCIRRSRCPDGTRADMGGPSEPGPTPPAEAAKAGRRVFLGDTMGELRKFYALADVVFVGRSLVPMGGSDVMEASALAKPLLVGPYTENFRDAVDRLRAADAVVTVRDAHTLAEAIARILHDTALASRLGTAARTVVRANQGATCRTVARLRDFLPPPSDDAQASPPRADPHQQHA